MGWSRSSRSAGALVDRAQRADTAWRDAATVGPSSGLLNAIDAYVVGSLADGDLTGVDWLVICATEDEQQARINLMAPSRSAPAMGRSPPARAGRATRRTSRSQSARASPPGAAIPRTRRCTPSIANLQTGSTGSAVQGGTSSGSLLRIQPSSAGTGSFNINATTTTACLRLKCPALGIPHGGPAGCV